MMAAPVACSLLHLSLHNDLHQSKTALTAKVEGLELLLVLGLETRVVRHPVLVQVLDLVQALVLGLMVEVEGIQFHVYHMIMLLHTRCNLYLGIFPVFL